MIAYYSQKFMISIHAPRGGSDTKWTESAKITIEFQSTLPVGGATSFKAKQFATAIISIHAPRGGSD